MAEETTLSREERLAWRALYEAQARILQRIDEDLHQAGVGSLSDYSVLFTLYEAPLRRVRLAELANAAFLSRSGLTRLVDRLETRGFLRREPCLEDRRGAFAVLTDEGIAELRRIWKVYAAGIARTFAAHLSANEIKAVGETFGRLRDALRPGTE